METLRMIVYTLWFIFGLVLFSEWGLEHLGPWVLGGLALALLLSPLFLFVWGLCGILRDDD